MDSYWGSTWDQSSSGSGADGSNWNELPDTVSTYSEGTFQTETLANENNEDDDNDEMYESHATFGATYGSSELRPGEIMNHKVPPAYVGGSWFSFEEQVADWLDITILSAEKHGPALKQRLGGEAAIFRPLLDREKLKDPDNGVQYLMDTLRPKFVKGVQNIFLFRLMQFLKFRRGKLEINRWLAKYALMRKRLTDAWNDLFVPADVTELIDPGDYASLRVKLAAQTPPVDIDHLSRDEIVAIMNDKRKLNHQNAFPFNDNLFTLIFMIQSDLSEQQRTLLTTHLSLRGVKMPQYNFEGIRELFHELLITPKTSLEDPNVRPRTDGWKDRSFFIIEEGTLDGFYGYWAEDEETGIEGFLDPFEDDFWIHDEAKDTFAVRRFKGRRYGKGRRKGKGKGKRKGGKGFRRFRPTVRRKGKGKGKGHLTEDGWFIPIPEEANATVPTGDSYKGKFGGGKGKRKGKKGKGKGKFPFSKGNFDGGHPFGKGKGDKGQSDATKAPADADGAADHTQGADDDPSWYWDDTWQSWVYFGEEQDSSWYGESWDSNNWWSGNQPQHYTVATQVLSYDVPDAAFVVNEAPSTRPYDSLLSDPIAAWKALKPIEMRMSPTYVILDIGCTRSMGSMRAVIEFEYAVWKYGITCEWKRCNTLMSFANSDSTILKWCVVITFPTAPPVSTTVDVHEKGDIPILMSLPQMMNLNFDISLRPSGQSKISSSILGLKREPLEFSTSRHAVIDFARIKGKLHQPNNYGKTFEVQTTTDAHSFEAGEVSDPASLRESEADLSEEEEQQEEETLAFRLHRKTTPQEVAERERMQRQIGPRRDPLAARPPMPRAKAGERVVPKVKAKPKAKRGQRGDLDGPIPGAAPRGGPDPDYVAPRGKKAPKPKVVEFPLLPPADAGVPDPQVGDPVPPGGLRPGDATPVQNEDGVLVPAPRTPEAQLVPLGKRPADTPGKVLQKIHDRLQDKAELLKLHLKHYHMNTANFKKRVSALQCPDNVFRLYEEVVKACESCAKHIQAPQRSKVTGMRAETAGDLWFIDHVDIGIDGIMYLVLIVVDAASNLVWAGAQKNKLHVETIATLNRCINELNCKPKAICGDNYFHEEEFKKWYQYHGIRPIELGPFTPWPNRAEAAVKLFKHYANILIDSIRRYETIEPSLKQVTVNFILCHAAHARNFALTYGGKSPLEIFFGRKPPDVIDIENMTAIQLASDPPLSERNNTVVARLAQQAHLEARQRTDIRRDLAQNLMPSDGPYEAGQGVWYWDRDLSKLRGGEWIKAKVVEPGKPPMVSIEVKGQIFRVNMSKLRKNPDPWHDVVIPGVDNRDAVVTVPNVSAQVCGNERGAPTVWWSDNLQEHKCFFMQFCNVTDKLSSVISSQFPTAEPVFMSEGFSGDSRDLKVCRDEFRRFRDAKPKFLWMTVPHPQAVPTRDAEQYRFCVDAAKVQDEQCRFFILVHPWYSIYWEHHKMIELLARPRVNYMTCDLSSFSDVSTQKVGSVCIVHNFPPGTLEPLRTGPYATKGKWEATNFAALSSDDFPMAFCDDVYRTAGKILSQSLNGDTLFMHEVLSDLTSTELSTLKEAVDQQGEVYLGIGHTARDFSAAAQIPAVKVTDPEVKFLMNWVNSRPSGSVIEMNDHNWIPRQSNAIRKMRKIYFPDHRFNAGSVYRGTLPRKVGDLQAGEEQAVVFMWRKTDSLKRLYASSLNNLELQGFDPKPWSIILLWNPGGGRPGSGINKTKIPTPVVPEGMRVDDEDMPQGPQDPPRQPPLPPPPGPPPGGYGNPDAPIPPMPDRPRPSPGQPPLRPGGDEPMEPPAPRRPERSRSRDGPTPLPTGPPPLPPPAPEEERPERSRSRDDPQDGGIRWVERSRSRDDPLANSSDDDHSDDDIDDYHRRARSRSRDEPRVRQRMPSYSPEPGTGERTRGRSLPPPGPLYPPPEVKREQRNETASPAPRAKRESQHSGEGGRLRASPKAKQEEPGSSSQPSSPPLRRTAVKTMPKPPDLPTDKKHDSDADSENEDLYCGACAVLSLRGDEKCRDCQLSVDCAEAGLTPSQRKGFVPKPMHWKLADFQSDLVILEDDGYWDSHSEEHKLAAMTDSFSYVTDIDDHVVDINLLENLPTVCQTLYLDNSWHAHASQQEILIDIEDLPQVEQQALLSALRTVPQPSARAKAAPKRKPGARREATAQEKRLYAKQFVEAKRAEYKSWAEENDIFELVDMRKTKVQNYITGRWVLTIKRDKNGNFDKCKARWVLRGFQDRQVWDLQTDSPTSTRPGFRLQCQVAANNDWDLTHIDLKTAFLQGDKFSEKRDIVCQLPPESDQPPYMAARLKRAAYGLNDAPRLWWNRLDKALRSYGLVPTRADRCCYVLYSARSSLRSQKKERSAKVVCFDDPPDWEAEISAAPELQSGRRESGDSFRVLQESPSAGRQTLKELDIDGALELLLDPITGSPAKGRTVEGCVTIHVDDALMAGTSHFVKTVVDGLRRDFKVGSEDTNDIMFVGQRVRWIDKGKRGTARIQVDQERKVEELAEIQYESSLRDTLSCPADLHKQYRSVLGQINWLQSRTQFQACYLFSRCASAAAAPTIGDVRSINKLVRKIRSEVVCLNFWPLKGNNRIVGYPDASYRNNEDKSSQRGQTVFMAEPRAKGVIHARGSLVDYESQKIKKTVHSTTVAELYAFMKCFGTCQFLRGLWMDMTGTAAEVHMRTDANNLVTTATTTHLPDQKETIHMIQMLRVESCSGSIEDLAHVVTTDMMADCLTKHSAKPDYLIKAIATSNLPNVDKHPPFRELMRDRHKAFVTLACWIVRNIPNADSVVTFFGEKVSDSIQLALSTWDWRFEDM